MFLNKKFRQKFDDYRNFYDQRRIFTPKFSTTLKKELFFGKKEKKEQKCLVDENELKLKSET